MFTSIQIDANEVNEKNFENDKLNIKDVPLGEYDESILNDISEKLRYWAAYGYILISNGKASASSLYIGHAAIGDFYTGFTIQYCPKGKYNGALYDGVHGRKNYNSDWLSTGHVVNAGGCRNAITPMSIANSSNTIRIEGNL